jgi:hypothetical protein
VTNCLRQLQQELPVPCSECGTRLPRGQLEQHLRLAHRIYLFRGKRYSFKDLLATLQTALSGSSPDYEAWQTLEAIAAEQYGAGAASFLGAALTQALHRVDEPHRPQALNSVAEAASRVALGPRLALTLAAETDLTARRLALHMAARLPSPLDDETLVALRGVLSDKRLETEEQLAGAAAVLRTTGKAGEAATGVLAALISGVGKARGVERLRQLEQRIGNSPALDQLCARLEEQVRMRCPRCPLQGRRPEMVRHLWAEHGLLLDGRRVREPWKMIEDWIGDYKAEGQADILTRCRVLGQRLDPVHGLHRVYQLFLANQIDDGEARRALLDEAGQQRNSLCPHCYALVPPPQEVLPPVLNVWRGRLSAHGYRVEVSETGLLSRLEIETPRGVLEAGPEPGQTLTRRGAIVLLTGPPVIAALLLALLLPSSKSLNPVECLLGIAVGIYLLARIGWKPRQPLLNRALGYAWSLLVPRLHSGEFSVEDSAFVASLAQVTLQRGVWVPTGPLEQVLDQTEAALAEGQGVVSHLAILRRLAVTQMTAERDPVPAVVAQVGRCFDGQLPLVFAQAFLAHWESNWWTPGNLSRLRALLCERAFEAGFEVRNLLDAVQAAPALREVLQSDDQDALAQLRLLWSQRPRKPWERCGPAVTVFDLAAEPESARLLAAHTDLLLLQDYLNLQFVAQGTDKPRNVQILVTCRGVVLGDLLLTAMPRSIEILSKRAGAEGIYELVVNEHRFAFPTDPDMLVARLERWLRFYFQEFMPQSAEVPRWQSPSVAASLRAQQAVPCPQCGQKVVTRVGEVGTLLEEVPAKAGVE